MISAGLQSDFDTPQKYLHFRKHSQACSLSDAISRAAVAFADALKGKGKDQESSFHQCQVKLVSAFINYI